MPGIPDRTIDQVAISQVQDVLGLVEQPLKVEINRTDGVSFKPQLT